MVRLRIPSNKQFQYLDREAPHSAPSHTTQKLTVIEKEEMLILVPQRSLDKVRGIAAGIKLDDYREKKDRL
jgi:hypothetical protein